MDGNKLAKALSCGGYYVGIVFINVLSLASVFLRFAPTILGFILP